LTPERYQRLCEVLDRRQPDLTVVLDRVNKPRNISAILRSCDAVGVQDVYALADKPHISRFNRTSGGVLKYVSLHSLPDSTESLQKMRDQGLQLVAAHLSATARPYQEIDYTRPTCLLMGAELYGVSDAYANLADVHALIPMQGMAASLNVSVAAALILYEAQRQRQAAGMYDRPRLAAERYRRLLFEWSYPQLVEYYHRYGVPYPEMDENGFVDDFGLPRGPMQALGDA
jgi:tRNA (guanosine-2'-O-)-methyltransferase